MRIILCVCVSAAVVAVACPARATDTGVGDGRVTNVSTKCFQVGVKTASREVEGSALAASDAGFRWLGTQFGYGLRLKGTQYKRSVPSTNTYYWYFVPERFAIGGNGTLGKGGQTIATAGGNPAGQALGSVTTFRLVSANSSVAYSLSYPWSGVRSWDTAKKIRTLTTSMWNNTGTSQASGTLTWDEPLSGAATRASGLGQLAVQSAVAPGGDGPYYATTMAVWIKPQFYRGTLNGSPASFVGLESVACSSVKWGG